MDNNSVSARNIGCMITIMTLCSVMISGFYTVGQDMWMALIIGTIMAIPVILMFSRISSINPGLDLFDIISQNFGKFMGSVLIILLSWYALHNSSNITWIFSIFVSSISLENTPVIFIMIAMTVASGVLASSSFNVLGKWSIIVFVIMVGNILFTTITALPIMHASYLKPIMEHSITDIFSASFSVCMTAFTDMVMVLVAFGSLKSGEKPLKAYLLGIGWGAVLLLTVMLRNIMVLGSEMVAVSEYPSFMTSRVISIASFIENIESVVVFSWITFGITKIALMIRTAAMGVSKLLGEKDAYKKYVIPISLLSVAISATNLNSYLDQNDFVRAYRYYAVIFTVLIPIVIWIKSEIKRRRISHNREAIKPVLQEK